MFCKQCGKEVKNDWNTCPNCGASLQSDKNDQIHLVNKEQGIQKTKKGKEKKPLYKRIWFWVLVIILIIIGFSMMGGSDDKPRQNEDTAVKTMDEVGGYAKWKEDEYPGKVRTDIVVALPITPRDSNDYCVRIQTSMGDPIFVKQADDSMVSEWDWLNNAVPETEGGDTAVFKATLTFDGVNVMDDQTIPVFIAEDIESYDGGTESDIITLPVTIINQTGIDIYGIYASTVDVDNWEENILGDHVLYNGDNFLIEFTYASNQTEWDFAMADSEGTLIEFYGLDFKDCNKSGATLTLEYDGENGIATLQ